jgi:large conductance mechanosensitive channel
MGYIKEFREFILRGKVVDLAIGVMIGGAFQKIISSLVNDVIMPPLGFFIGGVNFKELKLLIKNPLYDATGKISAEAVTINYGAFLQSVFDFIIIAFSVFIAIKAVNRINKRKKEDELSGEEKLLIEIRDLLKQK